MVYQSLANAQHETFLSISSTIFKCKPIHNKFDLHVGITTSSVIGDIRSITTIAISKLCVMIYVAISSNYMKQYDE